MAGTRNNGKGAGAAARHLLLTSRPPSLFGRWIIGSPDRIYLYGRYERFWHWSQAVLVVFMLLTGFEVHGTYSFFGFRRAVELHTTGAWALLTLWAFTIFWQFSTGEWKQYLPTLKKIDAMLIYYLSGIFKNAPHPYRKTPVRKHNPLQRLAYLALLSLVSPIVWGSGLLYLFYGDWQHIGSFADKLSLETVALVHTAGAFMMLVFLILHVYLATTGHTPFAHVKTMITGWEEAEPEGDGN